MYENDLWLFRDKERRNAKVILRVTQRQRERIEEMAQKAGLKESAFVMTLISAEHERQINESLSLVNTKKEEDVGDGLPL